MTVVLPYWEHGICKAEVGMLPSQLTLRDFPSSGEGKADIKWFKDMQNASKF